MRYYILFGPPGAGKGTHAAAIKEKYNYCHLSTGELLRAEIAADTQLGRQAKELITAGNLVPDEIVEKMIAAQFDSVKGVNGFLLDGFPRTLGQAQDLDKILAERGEELSGVFAIMISDEVVKERIRHRASIEGRADDANEETINNRIKTYHEQTEPLIDYYKKQGKYHEVIGDAPTIEQNRARVLALVEKVENSL